VKNSLIAAFAIATLGGCGLDVASSAATAAAIKKQELEQAKNTMKQTQQKIDQAMELQQQQQRQAESADK
jgi:NifU-like protein involved in Fe-S cluster formation